jgi:hypothetical protein
MRVERKEIIDSVIYMILISKGTPTNPFIYIKAGSVARIINHYVQYMYMQDKIRSWVLSVSSARNGLHAVEEVAL